jgi:hypothetical protein
MGIRRGSISTPIISEGLTFNMDAANRASYVPYATQAFDTIDSSISGSLTNNTSFGSPQDPNCNCSWDFDGTDDYILVAPDSSGPLHDIGTGDFTVSCWAWKSGASGYRWMIGAWSTTGLLFGLASSGQFACYLGDANENKSTFTIPTFGWNHYVITRLDGVISMYANANSVFAPTTRAGSLSAATEFRIGDRDGEAQDWLGYISNVHIYNRALSASEVLHNYNALKGRFA